MKNILFVFLLFSTALFAQQTDKKWIKVASYENEGKIKSYILFRDGRYFKEYNTSSQQLNDKTFWIEDEEELPE